MSYVLNNDLCSKILYSCKCLSQLQFHNLNTTYTFKTANRYYTNAKKENAFWDMRTLCFGYVLMKDNLLTKSVMNNYVFDT